MSAVRRVVTVDLGAAWFAVGVLPSLSVEPSLDEVPQKAAQLRAFVPGTVLVGGTAAALHAGQRGSRDHDHVLAGLALVNTTKSDS